MVWLHVGVVKHFKVTWLHRIAKKSCSGGLLFRDRRWRPNHQQHTTTKSITHPTSPPPRGKRWRSTRRMMPLHAVGRGREEERGAATSTRIHHHHNNKCVALHCITNSTPTRHALQAFSTTPIGLCHRGRRTPGGADRPIYDGRGHQHLQSGSGV
jgi:hypothetical protein